MADNSKIETAARTAIVDIAVENCLYFIVWDGHFGRYFVAVENHSKKKPEIYSAIYEHYYDVIGKDTELFRFNIPDRCVAWKDILSMVKANMPIDRK